MIFVVYFILTVVYCFGCCSKSEVDEIDKPLLDNTKKVEKPERKDVKSRYKLKGSSSSANNPFL